jgi:large subunit ribosomal protein L7/L12
MFKKKILNKMENIHIFAEQLSNLTVLECYQLAKILKEEYGIEPKTKILGVSVFPLPEVKIVEKTSFDVVLKSIGTSNKLTLIRTLKEMTGLSLLEAKTVVDNLPNKLKENVTKDEATAIETSLKELGAEIEVL